MTQNYCCICLENEYKYTCPACGAKTCSVECVKRHKLRSECTGTVDPTKFVEKSELSGNPNLINRDYNFLLNFERRMQNGMEQTKNNVRAMFRKNQGSNPYKRQRTNEADNDPRLLKVNSQFNNPPTSYRRENTLVIHLPLGMTRASQNKSGYDKKSSSFTWTIEWVPINDNGKNMKPFISFRLRDTLTLKDAVPLPVLANALEVPQEEVDRDKLNFYFDNVICGGKISAIPIDSSLLLASVIANKVVLEYPKIYVVLNNENFNIRTISEKEAYNIEDLDSDNSDETSDSDSESDSSSDSSQSTDSDSEDDSDSAPEEESSKAPETTETSPLNNGSQMPIQQSEQQNDLENADFSA